MVLGPTGKRRFVGPGGPGDPRDPKIPSNRRAAKRPTGCKGCRPQGPPGTQESAIAGRPQTMYENPSACLYDLVTSSAPSHRNFFGLASSMASGPNSAELSHSLKVLGRGRNTQKPVRNRSESIRDSLWALPREFVAWFRPVGGPIWAPNRRFQT
jgi:hypothetical protein